jgi:DNA-binding transcriptional ArsR family regulator
VLAELSSWHAWCMRPDLAVVGKALAAPARAAMVATLMDGQQHAASHLAAVAGVTASTASEHLAVLVASGLVRVSADGKFRRYRIADAQVAAALEALSRPGREPVTSLRLSREQRRLRAARTCYDHLAGQLGVAVHDSLMAHGWVDPSRSSVTPEGRLMFEDLGLEVSALDRGRRPLFRICVDWTERRDHLAGGLGAAIAGVFLESDWVRRVAGSRGLRITSAGRHVITERFGVPPADWLHAR